MSLDLLTLLTGLAGILAVIGVYSIVADLFLHDSSRISRRLDAEFRKESRARIQESVLFKNLGQMAAAEIAGEEAAPSLRERFIAMVERSGLKWAPRQVLVLMAAAGLMVGGLIGLFRQSVLAGLAAGILGAGLPFFYVQRKQMARMEKMMSQLPDAFDLMARIIRAGQTMSQALQAIADEFDQPIAGEFAYCYEQQNLGLAPETALRDLARRTNLLEVKIFVLALVVQQQSGGNLAELLDKLAAVIRERFRIRGKIRALTAEGRMQALVLLIMPVALMFLLMLISEDYARSLARAPSMITGMLVFEAFGALWIRKIVNFDF